MYIEQVNSPQDIKQFSAEQLRQLAGEILATLPQKAFLNAFHPSSTELVLPSLLLPQQAGLSS